jgi:hypothetical protein
MSQIQKLKLKMKLLPACARQVLASTTPAPPQIQPSRKILLTGNVKLEPFFYGANLYYLHPETKYLFAPDVVHQDTIPEPIGQVSFPTPHELTDVTKIPLFRQEITWFSNMD